MKNLYFLFLLIAFSGVSQNVTITKVIETGCADPFVKTVELYVDGTVDFSTDVTLNFMQNGAPWADNQIDVTGLGLVTDSFVYIVRDIDLMQAEFPSATFDATNTVVTATATNGDDGYQIVLNGTVVSQFGRTETDADNDTESDWNHADAVAIRLSGIPDIGTWEPTDWEFTPEDDLDTHTSCQNSGTTNLETYFATLGGNYPLGSGSGWTPTGETCTSVLNSSSVSCDTTTSGATDDTYTASIDFSGANNGNTFVVSTNAGTVGGDNPTSAESGTIIITNIPEGTDITVTVSDVADGGVCDLSIDVASPGCIPLIINELLFDPAADLPGDANGDGTRDALQDEFIEFYNNSNAALDISGYTLSDAAALRHTFPSGTIVPANSFIVVFGGGTPSGSFGGSLVQTASEGELNLSNGGDIVNVRNTTDDVVVIYDSSEFAANVSDDQAVTRNPDFSGDFVIHTDANASLLFSPGTLNNGTILSTNQFNSVDFRMFPNPVNNGVLHVAGTNSGTISVLIFDVLGKQILKSDINNGTVDVSLLNSGVYIVRLSQNKNSVTKKLIIK